MARPIQRTFVLFNHDKREVTVVGPKPSLRKSLDEAIARAKRFATTASGRSHREG
jgi:hypothetical protein